MDASYESVRKQYRPKHIKVLFIAESPPPKADTESSRHFYRTDKIWRDDRLFVNTIKALYPEASDLTESQLEPDKEQWLKRFMADGYYMIEALEESQKHEVTKKQRQILIQASLPKLLARVRELISTDAAIILIKSNVYEVVAQPLREAGYKVLNTKLLDYPGRYNQAQYREKLAKLMQKT